MGIDLGTAVIIHPSRTDTLIEGVVTEIVPPQKFPRSSVRGSPCLDYRTRFVVTTARRRFVRAASEMRVVSI